MDTVLAVVSDTHCGSELGLIPPGQWPLDAGGHYDPSKYQRFLWGVWKEYWEEIAKLRKGKRLVVEFNGDAIQGVDIKFTANLSQRVDEHERIFSACMDWALRTAGFDQRKGDLLYFIRGTERHTGPGAQAEERLAIDLGAEEMPGSDGRRSNFHIRIDINGVVFDFSHKRERAGGRWWTQNNGLYLAAKDAYARIVDQRRFKAPFNVVYIGSHYHHWVPYGQHRGPQGMTTCVITPCFQLMSGYSNEVTKAMEPPTIGAIAYTVYEDASWKPYELVYRPDHTPTTRL